MDNEKYMRKAMEIAKESKKQYKHAIGAIIVKDNRIVAEGLSMNQNFHAEINSIRNALESLDTLNLEGCTLYSTQEPCMMCLGAALYANVDRIVFGSYATDLPATNDYEKSDFSLAELAKGTIKFDGKEIQIVGEVLRDECTELMQDHRYWTAP